MRPNPLSRRLARGTAAALAAGLFLVLFAGPAHAYLDPGTGSMLLQVILGGFAAIGVALRLYWHRITSFFQRSESSTASADGGND